VEQLSVKDKLEIVAKFIGITASIAGGFIWLQTYVKDVNQRLTDRQKETIRYHELYNSKEMLSARETFAEFQVKVFETTMPKILAFRNPRQADEEGPKLMHNAMNELIRSAANKTDIPRLINFYEQLGACIEFELCDGEPAKKLFKSEAYELHYLLGGYIDVKRRYNPEYATGLRELAYETGYDQLKRVRREIKQRSANN